MSVKQLPVKTINSIKSSQVISSISSMVKELIENALDAEATVISVKLVGKIFLTFISLIYILYA